MTDNANVSAQPPVEQPQLTPEQQVESIRNFLFEGVVKHYNGLSQAVTRLPVNANLKRLATEQLDTAWLWIKECFQVLEINLPEPPKPKKRWFANKKKRK